MAENKRVRIPVASHGLHKHSYNYPWLSSINFGDVMPCYINTIRKGERDCPKAGMYSQLMPIAHNAFATGRYNFKAIFVPYKQVWRPWYNFDQQTEYHSSGSVFIPNRYPYLANNVLSDELLISSGLFDPTGDVNTYDVIYYDPGTNTSTYYLASNAGRRVLRILGALGCMPSFVKTDTETINILPILCYLKAYMDYYFPNNYVGNTYYRTISQLFERDDINYVNVVTGLVAALEVASLNYYENSIFDLAWDQPASPNVNSSVPAVSIPDVTNNAVYSGNPSGQVVTNVQSGSTTPATSNWKPSNGTPYVGGQAGTASSNPTGVLTKYVIDSLKALSLWTKRHQLAGARLLDRFLVSRGIELPHDSARFSYFIGQRNIEIQVSGVENNTDVNLGELAGRGVASSGDSPLSFECRPDDDGIFLVIVSPIPDANFPVLLDGFARRKDFVDNYTAEYDKLGAAAVPARIIQYGLNGYGNYQLDPTMDGVFGFLNQYWDEVQERPRLLGDFILKSHGAQQLRAYHTFRLLDTAASRFHSFQFIRMNDNDQYQRLFYSDKQENLMLFLRWYGNQYKEKLPLGDSYEWDDDELNRKVSVVVGGSQK